jgi:hypothetical protein
MERCISSLFLDLCSIERFPYHEGKLNNQLNSSRAMIDPVGTSLGKRWLRARSENQQFTALSAATIPSPTYSSAAFRRSSVRYLLQRHLLSIDRANASSCAERISLLQRSKKHLVFLPGNQFFSQGINPRRDLRVEVALFATSGGLRFSLERFRSSDFAYFPSNSRE